ncbi:hypothetical protein [Nocardioides stalactiti]|uniref:hypothetical protein n=1 Tax=Nocardioides stalactiti TaxID=2755356 RepID=UPI0016006C01|nr:hypothetical protein [Nocardioides stalactiti]
MKDLRTGDAMTRAQLIKFNPLWNSRDREVIDEDIDAFGGVKFEYYQSGYNRGVNVLDEAGTVLMSVAPGTIYYADGRTRPGSVYLESHGGHVYKTSRAGSGGGSAKPEPSRHPVCQSCWMEHPEGECDR